MTNNHYAFEANEQQLVWIYNNNRTYISWDSVDDFIETKQIIVFGPKEQKLLLFAVPKWAFGSYEESKLRLELFKAKTRN